MNEFYLENENICDIAMLIALFYSVGSVILYCCINDTVKENAKFYSIDTWPRKIFHFLLGGPLVWLGLTIKFLFLHVGCYGLGYIGCCTEWLYNKLLLVFIRPKDRPYKAKKVREDEEEDFRFD